MQDDDVMDTLLNEAMNAPVPELSPGFDARVMRRLRPRRLHGIGRFVMAAYVIAATATAAWVLRDLPIGALAAAIGVGASAAVGAGFYGRRVLATAP